MIITKKKPVIHSFAIGNVACRLECSLKDMLEKTAYALLSFISFFFFAKSSDVIQFSKKIKIKRKVLTSVTQILHLKYIVERSRL